VSLVIHSQNGTYLNQKFIESSRTSNFLHKSNEILRTIKATRGIGMDQQVTDWELEFMSRWMLEAKLTPEEKARTTMLVCYT
jgi:hypothetical protein